MSKYKNINKFLLGVFLVCLSSVSHGAGMPPYEEEVLKLADLTVPVSTRAEIAQNILSNGAPEHRQAASAACIGFLADLTVPVSTRAEIAQNILSNGAPEHCQEASAACTGPTHEEFS